MPKDKHAYDYIVIGSGTAGSVVAARLSEDPTISVLLIEAGPHDRKVEIKMPAGYPALQKTKRDWQLWTEPQTELMDRKLYLPRGKVLGGTGALNGMIYIRGNRLDYDDWAAAGNLGWGYQDVLPYFTKTECNSRLGAPYHGTMGEQPVVDARFVHPMNRAFIEAGQQSGLRFNEDFNGEQQDGVGYYQATILKGERMHTARVLLHPALNRKNLTLWLETTARQLTMVKNRVTGVIVERGKELQTVHANREVILCGGAIHSPYLLLHSGIGPADDLQRLAIPVQQDLAGVGQHMQDHQQYFLGYFSDTRISLNTALGPRNLWNWFVHRSGIFAEIVSGAGGFIRTNAHQDRPQIQFHFVPGIAGDNIHDLKAQPKRDGFMLGLTLLKPQSQGYLKLRSGNPNDAPLLQPNFLTAAEDLKILLDAYETGWDIMHQSALTPYRHQLTKPNNQLSLRSDREQFIRQTLESVYHTVGTCKMGPANDTQAVVDADLRVHGIDCLRIADASVMPDIPAGNVNAPIVMIAEKAAQLILGNMG
jgi:choline dehydrogenase